ncbi:hypothetical protein [Roseicella aquatilis]|uniref:Uncharacterized protein n=1 Tax=Roseicella aquatilis TaxID=2527868 RepID=A0A4R4DBI8_9PROT|nr:hypothetical protein [Roseicella aquatilis]TCZ57857.1 hypothetical protein EXY23_18025 [Roseicella aquatilis]
MRSDTRPLSPAAAAAQARRTHIAAIMAHKARCQELPRPNDDEVASLVAAFAARGGQVTNCPTVCVLPVQNGTGLGRA